VWTRSGAVWACSLWAASVSSAILWTFIRRFRGDMWRDLGGMHKHLWIRDRLSCCDNGWFSCSACSVLSASSVCAAALCSGDGWTHPLCACPVRATDVRAGSLWTAANNEMQTRIGMFNVTAETVNSLAIRQPRSGCVPKGMVNKHH
jgi:hypothetical protein